MPALAQHLSLSATRRRSLRHLRPQQGCGYATLGTETGYRDAVIHDISTDGIGLLLGEILPADADGLVNLFKLCGEYCCTRALLVVHATPRPEGGYLVGCEFTQPLDREQLQALLT